jgi:hypothetical protein
MKSVSPTLFIVHAGVLLLSVITLPALAEQEGEVALQTNDIETQSPVKAWLELQSSGEAASAQAQPLSGPVMNQVQDRYLKSFSYPVPPFFEHVQPIDN